MPNSCFGVVYNLSRIAWVIFSNYEDVVTGAYHRLSTSDTYRFSQRSKDPFG